MKIEDLITGEKFQQLAHLSISKKEHKPFEYSSHTKDIDINTEEVSENNPDIVYINSSLFNLYKPTLVAHNIYEVVKKFKNPFKLILHNSDQNIGEKELTRILESKCTAVYTQNLNTQSAVAFPLPIGFANTCWPWGNLETATEVINTEVIKTKDIYYYFTPSGGERDIHRQPCSNICSILNIPYQPKQNFKDYLLNLKQHKFSICPSGNGLDTHRLWESLYLKTIPICISTPFVDFFSKLFPMVVLDRWEDLDITNLENKISINNWNNYSLLTFSNYSKYINLI